MAWADSRTNISGQEEFQKFVEQDEKEMGQRYVFLTQQLEAVESVPGRYDPAAVARIQNERDSIARQYPHVLQRIASQAQARAIQREQEIQLTTQEDLSLDKEARRGGFEGVSEYKTDDVSMLSYSTTLNNFLAATPEAAFYIDGSPQGQRNSTLMGRYLALNHMSATDSRSWALAYTNCKPAMVAVKALPAPEPVREEPKQENKLFTQTVTVKTPWGTDTAEKITGAEIWEDGRKKRLSPEEVEAMDSKTFKRLFRPTQGINIPAAMR